MSAPGKNQGPVSILSRSLLFPISHDDELCWASPLFVPLISAHLSCLPSIHPSRAGPRVTLRRKRVSPNSRLLILDAFVLLFPFYPEFYRLSSRDCLWGDGKPVGSSMNVRSLLFFFICHRPGGPGGPSRDCDTDNI